LGVTTSFCRAVSEISQPYILPETFHWAKNRYFPEDNVKLHTGNE